VIAVFAAKVASTMRHKRDAKNDKARLVGWLLSARVRCALRCAHWASLSAQLIAQVEPFDVFREYADQDELMEYDAFCSLLDRLGMV